MDVDERLFMATRERAASLAGVRPSRLDYWARTGLVMPSVNERLTPHRPISLYSYLELLAAMIVAEMRARGVPLQHIRTVVDRVRDRGIDSPLTEVRYAVIGGRLYLQDENGHWEDGRAPGQGVIPQVLDLEPLRARIGSSARRPRAAVGEVEKRRRTLGHKEVISGTRIPVATIRRYLDAGRSEAEILREFPLLTRRDIAAVRSRVA